MKTRLAPSRHVLLVPKRECHIGGGWEFPTNSQRHLSRWVMRGFVWSLLSLTHCNVLPHSGTPPAPPAQPQTHPAILPYPFPPTHTVIYSLPYTNPSSSQFIIKDTFSCQAFEGDGEQINETEPEKEVGAQLRRQLRKQTIVGKD